MRSRVEKAAGIILLALFVAIWVWACWHFLTSTLRDRPDPKDFDWLAKQTCGGVVFVLAGAFVLAAVGFRWGWYVNHYKYRRAARLFGEAGARIFNIAFGVCILILGILMLATVIF